MLFRASVLDVKEGRLTRRRCHIAVVMQYYPRFLSRDRVDEYLRSLAPDRALFTEFKARQRETKDHNGAFGDVRYEERFLVSEAGTEELARLTEISRNRDVCLLCQCIASERCHGDLLLLLARHRFQANTPPLRFEYPQFQARL